MLTQEINLTQNASFGIDQKVLRLHINAVFALCVSKGH